MIWAIEWIGVALMPKDIYAGTPFSSRMVEIRDSRDHSGRNLIALAYVAPDCPEKLLQEVKTRIASRIMLPPAQTKPW